MSALEDAAYSITQEEITQKQCLAAANNAANTAMCLLKTALDLHFNRDRNFMNTILEDVLPEDPPVHIDNGVTTIQTDTAEPRITITREAIVYEPKNTKISNEFVRYEVQSALKFEVSTAAYAITENMAVEIGNYLCMSLKPLQRMGIRLQRIVVNPTTLNRPEHANFYISTVEVGIGLPSPVWTTDYQEGILREVKITPDILFVDEAVSGQEECLTLTTNR